MTLKPWIEIAIPHQDVLKGTFQQAEFAADLSRVHDGSAPAEYRDPVLFFQRTFITEGMRLLLDSVLKRLAGKGGDPVIQLQTAFGGGKTHTMLAVYHLAKGQAPASELQGVSPILDAADITELPKARIAVLDGVHQLDLASKPQNHGPVTVHTLWGELAWQLAGEEGYALVRHADESGTAPGKPALEALLHKAAPCVILIDELVRYISQFEEGKSLSGGTFDSNLSFVQALTEALKGVPTAILLASLPHSEKEAVSKTGIQALRTLEHYFARIQALWKPVGTEEAFEIVRRRLFSSIRDKAAMEAVCREFADFYIENASSFPQETQESRYYERLIQAYPIHPEVFDRLYEDWSSLDNFQRTRGVLKLMAQVIYRLWRDGSKDALLMPGSLPLYDPQTRNEVIYYLPQGWDPVLDKDVDGERAETTRLESADTRFGSVHACRRVARTIFLGSAPSTSEQMGRGIAQERVLLGAVQPGQSVGTFKDALRRILDKTQYFYTGNDRYWLDTRPGLRREMEDRRRRFNDRDDVFPMIRERLREAFSTNLFLIHPFTPSVDIPDDWSLRLVLLTPEAPYSRSGLSLAQEKAAEILRNRGEQPRQKQNRLIFLAADFDALSRLRDQVRSCLAWQSIVSDIKDMHLNLDQFQSREATRSLEAARDALKRMIRETYKWLLTPMQEAKVGGGLSELIWETIQVSASSPNWSQEIEKVLTENELLISNWSPIHLHRYLKDWFWKNGVDEVKALDFWQKSCQYLYLPRLRDDMVYRNTLAAGAVSEDFFGIAYGKEDGKYKGFTLGTATTPILDEALLLIEPAVAHAYAEAERAARAAAAQPQPVPLVVGEGASTVPSGAGVTVAVQPTPAPVAAKAEKRRFYATVNIEPVGAKLAFANIVEEVLQQFTAKPGVKVSISVEIEAESAEAFDDSMQRAVKENCNVLKFSSAEFES